MTRRLATIRRAIWRGIAGVIIVYTSVCAAFTYL